jgi:hypothetical protein
MKYLKKISLILSICITSVILNAQPPVLEDSIIPKANVDFDYFVRLVAEVQKHRETRLVDFQKFNELSKEENTIILDTRSKEMYDRMHIKGAIHINFSDFTQQRLAEVIPSKDTRVLIYCNNNFYQEQLFEEVFVTKEVVEPVSMDLMGPSKTLALNIPTYINLYGYNYRNVYELGQLVSSSNTLLELEGTDIDKLKK